MGPDRFNLRALERLVFRSVDELVDDCFPLRHKEAVERLVAREFENQREFGLDDVEVELFHQNFARVVGRYGFESLDRRGRRVSREAKVVIEGLFVFSPRNWSFRLDVVHMHAEMEGLADDSPIIEELLGRWKEFPRHGRFKYLKGVFFLALHPLPELQDPRAALGGCA